MPRLCLFLAGITFTGAVTAGPLAQKPSIDRRVQWSSEILLKDLVRPEDTTVLVLKPQHYEPFIEEPDAERELLVRAENADVVFIADIASVTPTVIDSGTWVTTAILARVTQILKHDPRIVQPTQRTFIVHDGGEISVSGVAVKVGAYPVIRAGQRYLMFAAHNRSAGTTHAGPAFLIDRSGTLVNSETSIDGPLPSVLNGMKVSNVTRLLRGR